MRAGRYAELQLPVIEALHRYETGLAELPARMVRRRGTDWTFARIGEVTSGADHIFLSVDMDVLDPAHAPGVGWHEPGGLTSGELLVSPPGSCHPTPGACAGSSTSLDRKSP